MRRKLIVVVACALMAVPAHARLEDPANGLLSAKTNTRTGVVAYTVAPRISRTGYSLVVTLPRGAVLQSATGNPSRTIGNSIMYDAVGVPPKIRIVARGLGSACAIITHGITHQSWSACVGGR